jgi:hypothetical protein
MIDYQSFYQAQLTSAISDTDTYIPLDNPPIPDEGFLVLESTIPAKREIIYYTSKDGGGVTVPSGAGNGRGYDGTTATTHAQNASVIMAPVGAMFKEFGNVTADSFIVRGSAEANNGWTVGLPAPNTVTNNGNRSYDLVFNGTDLTDTVSEGMRLRTTRTVSAPTQCADLERDNSQYFSKTSPAGISFTTTFTCSAWVKLESYGAIGGIIARRNADTEGWSFGVGADGTVALTGLRIASNNKGIASYQSIPLNKWTHVAACIDMTAGDTTAQKIWIDGVEVPRAYFLTGTATALVQGTTALVVGARKSAGTDLFDGKIAQASVHSACLSDAQVKALMTQTISCSSPSIVSGFTLNNTLADVSANANDLTAQNSALATNVDSPFGSYLGGTLDYGIITKTAFSTNTTLTVQVPEGCTIPTSGGVSAVAYSTQAVPYGFPRDGGRWEIALIITGNTYQSAVTSTTVYNIGGITVNFPVGAFIYSAKVQHNLTGSTDASKNIRHGLSTSASALPTGYEARTVIYQYAVSDGLQASMTTGSIAFYHDTASSYFYIFRGEGGGTLTNLGWNNNTRSVITLTPAYL